MLKKCTPLRREAHLEVHIWKHKVAKHVGLGPLLYVAMWKKRTPLWREAHLEVNCVKNWGFQTYFDM